MGRETGKSGWQFCKSTSINDLLEDIRTSLKNHYRDIEVHESFVTAEKVRNAFFGFYCQATDSFGTI